MISNFQIVQGATLPWLEVQLTKNGLMLMGPKWPQYTCVDGVTDPAIVDLTDAESVKFYMWKCGRTPLAVGLSGEASVSDPKLGLVIYKWAATDTSVPGLFYGRFVVTFKDNTVFQWPFQLEALTIEILSPETPIL